MAFTVQWATTGSTNCTMTQNGTALTKSGHWAWDNTTKKITVLASYITTLSVGTYTFVASGNSGRSVDKVTFTITKS